MPDGPAEQEQPDEKEQMIGADQNVMDAGPHELADQRERALTGAGKVLESGTAAVENGLRPQRVAFIDIEERLMIRIVGEHVRTDRHRTWPAGQLIADLHPERLPIGEHVGRRPRRRQRHAVSGELQSWTQQRADRRRSPVGHAPIEQQLGLRDVQIVREIDNMRDQRHLERSGFNVDVEVAEGDGMGGDRRRQCKQNGNGTRQTWRFHERQW